MFPRFLPMLKYLVALRMEQWQNPDALKRLQRERLEKIISCSSRTSHYGKIMEELSLSPKQVAEDLTAMPITEKEDIQKNPSAFINNSFKKLIPAPTSGSTGTPMDFFFDQSAFAYRATSIAMSQMEFGRTPFDLFAEIKADKYNPVPLLSSLRLFRKVQLSVFDDENKNFSILRHARPDILGWYPSTMKAIARLNDDAGRPLRLKSVFCGAEMLTKECRDHIQESFSCPVFDQYGAAEFGVIAWECPEEHSLHVNSTSCLVEIVDAKGRPKKSGTGRIMVSGLYNQAMPLLRYSIGDTGSWGKECSCGRGLPVLKSLGGRIDDSIVLPSGRIISPCSVNRVDDMTCIHHYQIIQEKEDLLTFRFVPAGKRLSDPEKKEVVRRIKRGCLGEEVEIEFEMVDEIKKGRTGKMKAVISKVTRRGMTE